MAIYLPHYVRLLSRLTLEKLPSGQGFDLAVRDSNTAFTFFNIEGHQNYDDAAFEPLNIKNARLPDADQRSLTAHLDIL